MDLKRFGLFTFMFVIFLLQFVCKSSFSLSAEVINEEKITDLLEKSLNTDVEISIKAFNELENFGPMIIPKFIEILEDENKERYHNKIHEVISFGILRNIYHDSQYYKIGLSEEIKNELCNIYSEDPFTLGFVDSEKSVSILKKMLKEPGKYRTIEVIDALGRIAEDKESVEMIKKVWKEDVPRSWVSDFAENAVKKITLRRILKQLKTEEKVILVKNLLEYETDSGIKSEFIWQIVRIKQKEVLPILIEYAYQLDGEAGEYASESIEYYLVSLPSNEALQEIEKGDTFLREKVISILGSGRYFESIWLLEMITEKDPDENIRKECARVLQDIKKSSSQRLKKHQ